MAQESPAPRKIHAILFGAGAVGKTTIGIVYTLKQFPAEYIPTISEVININVKTSQGEATVAIQDTTFRGDYEEIVIKTIFPLTDFVYLCFSVVSPHTFELVKTLYHPLLQQYLKHKPFALIGLKSDLRDDPDMKEKMRQKGETGPVSESDAKALAKELGALGYWETSSLKNEGVKEAIEEPIPLAIEALSKKHGEKSKSNCALS